MTASCYQLLVKIKQSRYFRAGADRAHEVQTEPMDSAKGESVHADSAEGESVHADSAEG
jgi:hypothetical protein